MVCKWVLGVGMQLYKKKASDLLHLCEYLYYEHIVS